MTQKSVLARMLVAAALAFILAAHAQDYPSKPIKIVVPFPPGGGVDAIARILAERLHGKWGQTVTVENRAGANGNIGMESVFRAEPDGYTLLLATPGQLAISKILYTKLGFDPDALVPVSVAVAITNALVIHPKVAAASVQELIALAKANPGRLNYATQGIGSAAHLTGELFQSLAGIKIAHVPYKGAAPALADLFGGQVEMAFLELSVALPQIRAGKLRVLAVGDDKRNPSLPDIPAMTEVLPGLVFGTWYGVVAPPKTPPAIANRLSDAIAEVIKQPDVVQQLLDRNTAMIGSTPAQMALLMKQDRERWGNVIRTTGVTAD